MALLLGTREVPVLDKHLLVLGMHEVTYGPNSRMYPAKSDRKTVKAAVLPFDSKTNLRY